MTNKTYFTSVIFYCFAVIFKTTLSDFGGHDLFTSLAQLEVLWRNERVIVQDMKKMLGINENVTKALEKYDKAFQLLVSRSIS